MPFLGDWKQRERIPEWMDDAALDPAQHRQALRGLARLNRFSGSAEILWPRIAQLAHAQRQGTIRILDIATGSGDIPMRLAAKAHRAGFHHVEFHGCDISPVAVETATHAAAQAQLPVTFFSHDILAEPLAQSFDIVICSLFLHHLDQTDALLLLQRMRDATSRLLMVNDLVRSPWNYALVWLTSRMLSRSPVVHFDGPASVRSAFTLAEARTLAEEAGLSGVRVHDRFPCRFLLVWSRP